MSLVGGLIGGVPTDQKASKSRNNKQQDFNIENIVTQLLRFV